MSKGLRHQNLIPVLRALAKHGAQLVEIISTGKHLKVRALTQLGNRAFFTVSKGPVEKYKLLGWTRQALNRADAHAATQEKEGKCRK